MSIVPVSPICKTLIFKFVAGGWGAMYNTKLSTTTRLLDMLKAAKNSYKAICRKAPATQSLLTSPASQPNYYDCMG